MCAVSVEKFSLLSQHKVNIRESTVGRNLVSVSCRKTFRTSCQLYHEYAHPRENPVLVLGSFGLAAFFYPPFRVIIAFRLFLECHSAPTQQFMWFMWTFIAHGRGGTYGLDLSTYAVPSTYP